LVGFSLEYVSKNSKGFVKDQCSHCSLKRKTRNNWAQR